MSFSFPDNGNSYRIKTQSAFATSWNKGSWCCWFKLNTTTDDNTLFHIGNTFSTGQPVLIWRDETSSTPPSNKSITCMITAGGNEIRAVSSQNSISTATKWFHLVCSFDTTKSLAADRKPKIYINGIYDVIAHTPGVDYSQNAAINFVNNYTMSIGRPTTFTAARHLYGFMEDMRVYDRQLSAAEVQTIYSLHGKDNIVNGLVVRTVSNLGANGIDVPLDVPDISPLTTNLVAEESASGQLILSDNFTFSPKRNPKRG